MTDPGPGYRSCSPTELAQIHYGAFNVDNGTEYKVSVTRSVYVVAIASF